MKFLKQFGIILFISFIGEILNNLIPLPIPASIYGLVIMFIALNTKLINIDSVEQTSGFLIEIMPIMFIPAAVGLMESWNIIKPVCIQYVLITFISTFVVMIVSGRVTQFVIRREKKEADIHD